MRQLVSLLIGIGFMVHAGAQSEDYGLLQRYFASQSGFLPIEGAELEATPNFLSTRGMVFRSTDTIWDTVYLHGNGNGGGGGRKGEVKVSLRDSIHLYATGTGCPLCLGCQCVLTGVQRLASIPLDSVHSGLPLQKIARVWGKSGPTYSSPRPLYFLIARRSSLLLYTYQVSYSSNPPTLQSVDTIEINSSPPLDGRFVLGIDTFYQAGSSPDFQFRLFGQRGWIGSAAYTPGARSTVPIVGIPLLSDSLDIFASGEGYFGTLNGHILDPGLGFSNPVKAANGPISVITSKGAVGDSGLFVLHEQGRWRTFRLGSGSLRNFSIVRISSNYEGAWGTRGNFWDNRFQMTPYFVKDDSTVWSDFSLNPPRTISEDSTVYFTSVPDSITLSLFDPDSNYSHPALTFYRYGNPPRNLDGIWGDFSRGCGASPWDTITCYRHTSVPRVFLAWDPTGVRVHSDLRKGAWFGGIGGINQIFFTFNNSAYSLDTLIPWSPGDTLRVKFSNAAYNLINASPVAIPSFSKYAPTFQIRVVGGEIRWKAFQPQVMTWVIRDLSGRPIMRGRAETTSGTIHIPKKVSGINFISFIDSETGETLWQSRLLFP